MNIENTTVIICCAGMGTRLGIGTSKCLIDINGDRLIMRLLKNFEKCKDIRIVVGFQAQKVIDIITKYRKDIIFAFNYDYKNTGPAASVSKALQCCKENILILDGDIVIPQNEINKILSFDGECIAYTKRTSDEPVFVEINYNNEATLLNSKESAYEWPGIVKIKRKNLIKGRKFIYDLLNPILPMKAIYVNAMGIDTQEDYERVIKWQKDNYRMERDIYE